MEQPQIDALNTRIYELEQLLQERTTELDAVKEDFQSFSNKISHDLHAPLRAICTYLQMIGTDYVAKPMDEDGQRMIARVMSNAEEMKKMLDGLLEFVRTGKKELVIKSINMNSLVNEICKEMQKQFPQRKLVFQLNDLAEINADEELMKKALLHLISNAVKFTEKKESARIEISSEKKEDQLVYAVKDDGDGFDMNYYSKLFGVFQRLHHKTDFEGTGIGLAIVNKIISRHKGKVWAEGKAKEGATFYFSLPG